MPLRCKYIYGIMSGLKKFRKYLHYYYQGMERMRGVGRRGDEGGKESKGFEGAKEDKGQEDVEGEDGRGMKVTKREKGEKDRREGDMVQKGTGEAHF